MGWGRRRGVFTDRTPSPCFCWGAPQLSPTLFGGGADTGWPHTVFEKHAPHTTPRPPTTSQSRMTGRTSLSLTTDPSCQEIIQLEALVALHPGPGARAHRATTPLWSQDQTKTKQTKTSALRSACFGVIRAICAYGIILKTTTTTTIYTHTQVPRQQG